MRWSIGLSGRRGALRIIPVISALICGGPGLASAAAPATPDDRYLLAIRLDGVHGLTGIAAVSGHPRWLSEHRLIFETDRFGLAACRQAGYDVSVIDHPVLPSGYVIFDDVDGVGLPSDLLAGADAIWREGHVTLYRGLDLTRVAAPRGARDLHLSTLPDSLPLGGYLSHQPPEAVLRALERSGGRPAPLISPSALDGLEGRLRKEMHELTYDDTTGAWRTRYAYDPATRDYAAAYIRRAYLDALGGRGTVTLQSGFACGHASPAHPDTMSIEPNVIATVPGHGHGRGRIIVSAHYDAIASRTPGWDPEEQAAPGADDNASGVAATIEILRLLAPLRFDFDLVAAAWACEEILPEGLWGSRAYAESAVARGDTILAVINLDMLGNNPGEDRLDILSDVGSQWIADLLLSIGPPPDWSGTLHKVIHLERPYSDHNSFWDRGIDAVTIDENENVRTTNPDYHRVSDRDGAKRMIQVTTAVRLVAEAISSLGSRPAPAGDLDSGGR